MGSPCRKSWQWLRLGGNWHSGRTWPGRGHQEPRIPDNEEGRGHAIRRNQQTIGSIGRLTVYDRSEYDGVLLRRGARWARRTYCTDDGKRCLLGALQYVRCETGHRDDRVVQYLARAINLRQLAKGLPPLGDTNMVTIIGFNDSFGRSFADVAAVLSDAKQLSVIDFCQDKDLDI